MRILAVIPGTESGGGMDFSRQQVASLCDIGLSIYTYYFSDRLSPRGIVRAIRELVEIVKKQKISIVHAHYGTITGMVSAIAAIVSGARFVITFHGTDLNNTSASNGILRDFGQRSLSNIAAIFSSAIICVSARLKSQLWWGQDKAVIVPCGVDLDVFRPLDRDACRAKLDWDKDGKYLLFNNRNKSPVKREDVALATIAQINGTMPSVKLHVLRDSPPSDVPIYLNASDCLLVCSDSEGSPMILKEAMACNLPVVSVDVGDIAERLSSCFPSKVVARAPDALAKAVVEILQIPARSNGRQLMAKSLNLAAVARQVADIYSRVYSKGNKK